MTKTKQGSVASTAIIIIAIIAIAAVVLYYSKNKTETQDTNVAATTTSTETATTNTTDTPNTKAPAVGAAGTKESFQSGSIGDITFNYNTADYTFTGQGYQQNVEQILLQSKGSARGSVYVSKKTITDTTKAEFTEAGIQSSNSVAGGVPFKALTVNGLPIYEGTTKYEANNYVLSYSIIYKGNLYTFLVTPAKASADLSTLGTNKKNFDEILQTIQAKK
ncbi:MAG: hypothetical protein V4576_03395 [Patescibacteria group bacterium]